MITQTMNNLFVDLLDKRVVVFLDDILIYRNLVEDHFKLLKKVFKHLCKHVFYCKLKKCSLLQKTTGFFGFCINLEGMKISNSKVKSLKNGQIRL